MLLDNFQSDQLLLRYLTYIKKPRFLVQRPETRYTQDSLEQLVNIFEDNDKFLAMNHEEYCDLFTEINNRLAKSLNAPSSSIDFHFSSEKSEDELNLGGCDMFGRMFLNIFSPEIIKDMPYEFKQNLGLEYLFSIIHESRHAYQTYFRSNFWITQKAPVVQSMLAYEDMMVTSLLWADEFNDDDRLLNYVFSGDEFDANLYAVSVIEKFIEKGIMKDEEKAKDFIYDRLVCEVLTSHNIGKMAKNQENHYKFLTKNFKRHFKGTLGNILSRDIEKLDTDLYFSLLQAKQNQLEQNILNYSIDLIDKNIDQDRIVLNLPRLNELQEQGKYYELFHTIKYALMLGNGNEDEIDDYNYTQKDLIDEISSPHMEKLNLSSTKKSPILEK